LTLTADAEALYAVFASRREQRGRQGWQGPADPPCALKLRRL